jgi:Ca-activated chloride channel family protein
MLGFMEVAVMQRLAKVSILALASTVLVAPASLASGFIVIDSSLTAMLPGVPMMPVVVPQPGLRPVRPGRPPTRTPVHPPVLRPLPNPTPAPMPSPTPHNGVLKGGVSFGLHLQSEEIKVDINDQVAKTYITQTFMNDTDRNLAGTYLFPLPDDTTFSSFSLHIDGKPVEGRILEAMEARQQYEQIVRQMVDPGLLEYADYKTVRARIFPIPAHGTKKVELEYTQVLHADNGMLKYNFPLKGESEGSVDDVKIKLKIASKQGLRTIWSPSHEIESKKSDDHHAEVVYNATNTSPDKDFLLYYSVSDKELSANALTHKIAAEDGYFLLTLTPPMAAAKPIAKDVVVAVDTSGSMQGEKIQQAKNAMKFIVNALNADDRVGLIEFNTDVETFKPTLVQATPENKKKAIAFIDDLEARGGTNIGDAVSTGVSLLSEATPRPGYLILMTDGQPTVGETNAAQLISRANSKRDIRLFDFGVGYDVNTKLLNKLAEAHHGYSQYVEPKEDLETAMSSFYQKIKSPMLSNVKITIDGIQTKDIYPREVKDIFAGSQVLLIGKYKSSGAGSVHLTGNINGLTKSYTFPVTMASNEPANTYLPRLWAMRRIGHLTDVAQENSENKEVVDEIVSLSKKYGIISAYTSFLVTDPSENHRIVNNPIVPVFPSRRGQLLQVAPSVARPMMHGGGSGSAPAAAPVGMAFGSMGGAATGAGAGGNAVVAQAFSATKAATNMGPFLQQAGDNQYASAGASNNRNLSGRLMSKRQASFTGAKEMQMDEERAMIRDLRSAPVSGEAAVSRAKAMNALKSTELAYNKKDASEAIKVVEDKTFYLVDGIWTDSSYDAATNAKRQQVAFGSDEYFKLVRKNPSLAKYLAVGKRVIIMFNGVAYEIIPPTNDLT